jgi:hypothetical protein
MKTIGIVLVVVGIVMIAFTGFTLVTKKKVFDVGSIEITKEEKTPIYWSPLTGAIITGAGAVLLILARQKRK